MKKIIFSLILAITISFQSKAQWVSLPDTNFGYWLSLHGYTACLQGSNTIGWQLDTTCPQVITDTSFIMVVGGIHNLKGIEYFDNLRSLTCYQSQLTTLPAVPSTLENLNVGLNQLTTLPPLPAGLTNLRCEGNILDSLPSTLPSGLTLLGCNGCGLHSLPPLRRGQP